MKKLLLIFIILIPIKIKAFETSATAAILMDIDTNRILYSKNIHEVRSIASISKIMTAILAIESNKLEDIVTITEDVNKAYGSGIYIKPGEQIKLIDLVYGLMLRSGNDAAITIAKYVGNNEENFKNLMNQKAKEIGMKNTEFNNPSGLDDDKGNYSTAYDMALLTSYAMKNEIYKRIVSTKKYTVKTNLNTYIWYNKNKLLNMYKYATGGKTGYTKVAKRTLVTTASHNDLNLVAVTLNDGNDFTDHKNLYEEAFKTYYSYKILKKGNINIIDEDYYNKEFYIKENFSYPLLKDEKTNIYLKIELEKLNEIKDEQKIGKVYVINNKEKIYETEIYVKNKEELSLKEKIKKWWKNIW